MFEKRLNKESGIQSKDFLFVALEWINITQVARVCMFEIQVFI